MSRRVFYFKALFASLLVLVFLPSCNRGAPSPVVSTSATSPSTTSSPLPVASSGAPQSSPTPFEPSPTPSALAVRITGNGGSTHITLEEYQSELARYQAAHGDQASDQDRQIVLTDLTDEALLAQGAAAQGYVLDAGEVQARIDQLAKERGGQQALLDWMAANGYDEQSFRHSLEISMAAAWMRDQITSAVPEAAEQIHARQILLYNADQANEVLAQLQAGGDFAKLAANYDPVTEGELGWFPRGYLTDVNIENAAFKLEPGQYSQVIEDSTGFHIIQVIERDPQRPLSPQARQTLQVKALQDWLNTQRSQSNIQILLP